MTSDGSSTRPDRTFVWTWLPDRTHPVVAGALDPVGDRLRFVYGQSYLARDDAVPIGPDLPLTSGGQLPPGALEVHGSIADGAPDAWGRQVILHRLRGGDTRRVDTAVLPTLAYLLESGSNRIGANDYHHRSDRHRPRIVEGTVEEVIHAADRMRAGVPFDPEVDAVLLAGSSVGGARPKALLRSGEGRGVIAKFSTPTDHYPVARAEAVGMELARRVGLDVADSRLERALDRDVLVVTRFDREADGRRRGIVSALTLLELHEMHARYATYPDLADRVRARFNDPAATLRELFNRIVCNILIGNTDDHARNHAAFWDGSVLALTPAYDLCPQPRDTGEAAQAMAIGRDGERRSRLVTCMEAAEVFLLERHEAREDIEHQLEVIHQQWDDAAEAAGLTRADKNLLWGRAILHPYAREGWPGS